MAKLGRKRTNLPRICACGATAWMRGSPRVTILVDASDIELLLEEPWHVNTEGYAHGHSTRRKLHRVLVPDATEHVDHANRNRADCRRLNLRPANHSKSMWNRSKLRKKIPGSRPSIYKGVTGQINGRWMARLAAHGERLYLGTFDNEVDAALAYDAAAREHHGEFAATNF